MLVVTPFAHTPAAIQELEHVCSIFGGNSNHQAAGGDNAETPHQEKLENNTFKVEHAGDENATSLLFATTSAVKPPRKMMNKITPKNPAP